MWQYATRRIMLFIPTLILATMLVFALFWIIPGDAAMMILTGDDGDSGGRVGEAELAALRHKLGLDRPVYVQYGDWLWNLVQGDLGTSTYYSSPVFDDLKERFPITLQLAAMALLIAFVIAVPLGIISAVKQDSPVD